MKFLQEQDKNQMTKIKEKEKQLTCKNSGGKNL
jgi:hypothetical protein